MSEPIIKERMPRFHYGADRKSEFTYEIFTEFRKNPDVGKVLDHCDQQVERAQSLGYTRKRWNSVAMIAQVAREALFAGDLHAACLSFYELGGLTENLIGESTPEQSQSYQLKEYAKIAAESYSKGGRGNKGKPGFFAGLLSGICDKIDSVENVEVFKHWQRFDNQEDAESEPKPRVWAVNLGTGYEYWYADKNDLKKQATKNQIKMAMTRLRKRASAPK